VCPEDTTTRSTRAGVSGTGVLLGTGAHWPVTLTTVSNCIDRYQYDTIHRCWAFVANLLVRDLDDEIVRRLKASAKAHGRSLQAEIHEVLRNATARRLAETRRLSARWLKHLRGSTQTDSAALIREDRDRR
jgi:antitoxin FitA